MIMIDLLLRGDLRSKHFNDGRMKILISMKNNKLFKNKITKIVKIIISSAKAAKMLKKSLLPINNLYNRKGKFRIKHFIKKNVNIRNCLMIMNHAVYIQVFNKI